MTILEHINIFRDENGFNLYGPVQKNGFVGYLEKMRNAPPPFSADKENPMKHIYQNQGYAKALDDMLSLNKLPDKE